MRTITHSNRLPREVVEFPLLETVKTQFARSLEKLMQGFQQEVGPDDQQNSLPTSLSYGIPLLLWSCSILSEVHTKWH